MTGRSKRWLQAHSSDAFVKKARRSHYRSRAVYKLIEIDEKDHLFPPGGTVVDLGAAPGSWSQYASERVGPHGQVIAIDLLPMAEIANVQFIQGDFTDNLVYERSLMALSGGKADLVISDMAPNITGIRATDNARSLYLAELVLDFSKAVLKSGGDMLIKMFQGAGTDAYKKELVKYFQRVVVRKPKASRDNSREFYILARGYDV